MDFEDEDGVFDNISSNRGNGGPNGFVCEGDPFARLLAIDAAGTLLMAPSVPYRERPLTRCLQRWQPGRE